MPFLGNFPHNPEIGSSTCYKISNDSFIPTNGNRVLPARNNTVIKLTNPQLFTQLLTKTRSEALMKSFRESN